MLFNINTYKKKDGIGIITLNRPNRMNTICNEVLSEFSKLIEEIEDNHEISTIIMEGGKDYFPLMSI